MKSAQTTLGLFSEPSYISIGDEYDPPAPKGGRHKGLNIMTQNVKKGTVPQYTNFDRTFRRISDGDTYVMPGSLERKWRKEAWTKCTTADGFRYSHPAKHRTGLGDVTGNFSKWHEFMPRGGMEKKTKNDIPPPAKPNIMTNPVKKGSYGVYGNYINQKGTEYLYMIEPYDRPRELEIEERRRFKEKTNYFTGGKPFNTSSHARDCFDKDIYEDPEQLRGGYRNKPAEGARTGPPFVPSQPPKTLTAFTGCFSKFPKHVPEPPVLASPGKAGEEGKERPVFCPSSPPKSMRTKSIMFRSMGL